MDLENNKNLILKQTYNHNEPFLGVSYPKIMSYVLSYDNNIYYTSISDTRIQHIEKIRIKLTLPEIIGKGIVSYKKYYPYHLIKYIEIYYKNKNDNNEILLIRSENEELLMNLLSKPTSKNYFNHCSGKYDPFCRENKGLYNDCIIFPEKHIEIPIELLTPLIRIFPETTIIFKIELNDPENMFSYDLTYEKKSLFEYKNKFQKINLNLKLEFENTVIFDDTDNGQLSPIYFLRKKPTIAQHNALNFNTQEFKNCLGISFNTKTDIFTNNNKFIINMGIDISEQALINKWIMNILQDLIIITDLDLTDNNVKETFGFEKKAIFEEVVNNIIYFDKNIKQQCEIYIELIPENYKIFYHTNLLTFSRRYKFSETINVSKLFKYIKGFCFGENNIKIKYILEDIQHDITLDIISMPVNIWTHTNNTSSGDARSDKSKSKDFIYKNDFILGLDYLSKDKGYSSLSISAGRDIFEYYDLDAKYHDNIFKYFKIIEYNKNNYPNIAIFNLYSAFKKFITCDENINFTKFLIKVKWNTYEYFNPKSLYNIIPYVQLYELMVLSYNKDNNTITLKAVEKNNFL